MYQAAAAVFLVLFVLCLIYVVRMFLKTDGAKLRGYIVIPVKNSDEDIKMSVKSAYWDEIFKDKSKRKIILYPLEALDESTERKCYDLCREFKNVVLVSRNYLDLYIKNHSGDLNDNE